MSLWVLFYTFHPDAFSLAASYQWFLSHVLEIRQIDPERPIITSTLLKTENYYFYLEVYVNSQAQAHLAGFILDFINM